jgi:hypothetical protein
VMRIALGEWSKAVAIATVLRQAGDSSRLLSAGSGR